MVLTKPFCAGLGRTGCEAGPVVTNTPEQGQRKHNKKKMDQVKDRALGQVRHKDRALAVLEIPDGSSQGPGPWAKVGHKDRALAGLEFFPAVRLLPQKADCQEKLE